MAARKPRLPRAPLPPPGRPHGNGRRPEPPDDSDDWAEDDEELDALISQLYRERRL